MDPNVSLRPEQVERLAQYISQPRFLDLSDPGTGKTPPVCTYLYYVWREEGKTSIWTQPKSLLGKNRRELLRWTPFEPDDVVILTRDWAPIPSYGTNLPTKERVKTEQFADQVIVRTPHGAPCSKGDIVPFEVIEQWREMGIPIKYDFDWIYSIQNAGGTDLPIGMRLRASDMKKINAELKVQNKKPVKGKRLYETREIRESVIDTIAAAREQGAKVLLCSFHFHRERWQELQDQNLGLLAVDELHMGYGGIESQTTQALYGTMRRCPRFIGMTGTLLNGKLDSVYPAIHVIEPNYYPMGYADFRNQHVAFEDDYGRVLAWKNEAKVGQILLRHGVRRTFTEVYGKEDVVFLPDVCDMNEQMREQYDLFHDQAMLELADEKFLDGSLPGVATIRARQIMAHPETFGLCEGEMTGKDERLEIHIADAIARGENLLIFSVHVAEQERIKRLLESHGRRAGIMNSSVSALQRDRLDMAFQGINENGVFVGRTIDDVVGSPQTMAVGWNWQHVDHVVAASLPYTDVDWLQAYRRASRGTRTKTLRVSIMQYADSVDQRVMQIIHEKSVLANKVDPTRPIVKLAA